MPGSRRFSQAISEGDGISVIVPVGDAAGARAAEDQGAEAIVLSRAVDGVLEATSLPILWRGNGLPADAHAAGADACVIVVERHADGDRLEFVCGEAAALGLECVLDVRDEEELEQALERIDPEIFLLSCRDAEPDEDPLDHVLALLPDVPAGKLAIADVHVHGRDDVVALERAGVDAVAVAAGDVAELVGGSLPDVYDPGAALLALLALAAGLRAVGIQYGLPFGLLNPDEQSIVPLAWRIGHSGSPNPHGFFDYPTLVPELLAPFQAWQGSPSYLTARIVVLVLGVGAVAAAWWLGSRAYGRLAGTVAAAVVAVDATAVAYSRMAVTDVPLMLGVSVSLALTIGGQLELAGLAAGLAMGAKYPGIFLLVPIVLVGWRTRPQLARALGLAALGFLATSPFVLVHPGEAWSDTSRVQRLAHAGWLGFEHDHVAPIAWLDRLWEGLGPALIIAVVGLGYALAKRTRADVVLSSFVLVYFLDLLTVRAHFDRYTLPLIAPLGALAGRMRALAPVTLLLLLVPLVWDVRADHRLTRTDTRVVAQRWIEAHVPPGSRVAADSSTPPLPGLRVLGLKLPGPGRPSDPNRDVARLRSEGVRYVLVTGAVADRVLAARGRYPLEARFYDQLRRRRPVYRVDPGSRYGGPWVALYRLYPG